MKSQLSLPIGNLPFSYSNIVFVYLSPFVLVNVNYLLLFISHLPSNALTGNRGVYLSMFLILSHANSFNIPDIVNVTGDRMIYLLTFEIYCRLSARLLRVILLYIKVFKPIGISFIILANWFE